MARKTAPADVITLDDALSERIMEATHGAVAPCFQCGVCTATCPWGQLQDEPVNVRRLMHRAQIGIEQEDGAMWWCTTCRACEELCPRGVPIADVMVALRDLAWKDHSVPKGVSSVMWAMYWDGNPWRRPPTQRTGWSKGVDAPRFSRACDVLFYVGCTPSYDGRSQKVARALARIFGEAGVTFGTLGEQEPCCGDAAYGLGQHDYLHQIVETNTRFFAEEGVSTLVTTSPHCYDMFATTTRRTASSPSTTNTWLIIEGKLTFEAPRSKLTFHDPCYLGRANAFTRRAPCRVVSDTRRHSSRCAAGRFFCCGGGGGRMWIDTKAANDSPTCASRRRRNRRRHPRDCLPQLHHAWRTA
jgi:Fe-S oxidoreductase